MDRRSMLGLGAMMCAAPWSVAAGGWEEEFSRFMMDGLRKTGTAGMGVAAVRNGRTLFVRGYGLADMRARTPVTADTAFHVASASKVVTGTAMMMLHEQGAFKLDDPVGPLLDFPLAHPLFPDTPITFRHLLSHTSGISDAAYNEKAGEFAVQGNGAPPLRDFLAGYLSPGGRWYAPAGSYAETRPGAAWAHSDVGLALLGHLAGRVGADKLDALTQKRLFSPLGMRNTGWTLASMGRVPLAQPYARSEGMLRALPPAAYPDGPSGQLRTSARDFARILEIFSGEGAVDGRRYLQQGTLATFLSPQPVAAEQDSQQALIWTLRDRAHLAMHGGGDTGADSLAMLDLERHVGALAFCNVTGNENFKAFQKEAVTRLLERARGA
ncbi:serine hydrolase domain-containing protein [Pseudoduganella namucuonensis]|uniref:CubicO group peptidase, beta-lactamase class C family n=1 Tax=Pseudoduganella namucuonensis TaxID=1035707 RepID=A0A1I7L995_9BURK|nr:serine hydrolase domain-containing protein [Pseudoduganella namucuonensis]SFV06293.1 CubicO group peptidase, beta-lactamase class C family [Pseudoduganella namucuonensis]